MMDAAELKEVVRLHGVWATSMGGARADLRGADLSGADLSMVNLCCADLLDANLRGANLIGAKLEGASLSRADLTGADLRKAKLDSAMLRKSVLRSADLRGASLYAVFADGLDARDADMSGADLRNALLSGADLRGANLSGSDLKRAHLNKSNLEGARLPIRIVVDDLDMKIEAATRGDDFDMGEWHSDCGTVHCRAGHAVLMAGPKASKFEESHGPGCTASLIYAASGSHPTPDWNENNESARADMLARAGRA